jgi:hypothetical protein
VFVIAEPFGDAKGLAGDGNATFRIVGVQAFTVCVRKGDAKRRMLHCHPQRSRGYRAGGGANLRLRGGRTQVVINHGVGMVTAKVRGRGEPDADDIVGKWRDGECALMAVEAQRPAIPGWSRHFAEGHPARHRRW